MQKKFQKAGLIKMNDLKLNKELYKYEDIILVTKVFSHLALIEVEEDNNYWKCKKCGYEENSETSAFCEKCGAISESKKSVLKSFIERQLSTSTLPEITNCQNSYFNTDSLSWLKEIVPNVEDFTDINEYKENLKTVSQKYI